MASDSTFSVFEKPRRAGSGGKTQATSISPKEILTIMSGKFNEEPVSHSAVVKKRQVDEQPTVIPTHKMEMCRVCGKIGTRIRFLTAQRDVCSRSCEHNIGQTTSNPTPWIDFEADLTVKAKREPRLPERTLRRRGNTIVFRWHDVATGGGDLKAAPVHYFPHAPATALWKRITIPTSFLPSRLVVETELPGSDAPATALWIARVTAIRGYMARLRYEGVDDPGKDFWVNLASQTYPLGWAAANGRPLVPPRAVSSCHDDDGWRSFLTSRLSGCQTLPWDFARQLTESKAARFKPGMRMELVDKDQITRVRLARVERIAACRLHMRYVDAGEDDPGFVCHQDSPLIHPVGWAHRVGAIVLAPTDYLLRCEVNSFLPEDAQPELFLQPVAFHPGPDNRILAGMKLEAIDPLNLSAICVGTVAKVLREGYLMVRIESYDEEQDGSRADWFCYHAASPSIFRAGFCQRNGLRLVPPKGFTGAGFTWDRYLRQTGAKPAPLPPHVPLAHGFAPGHRIEAADLMDPRKVCVASVAQVVGRLLRIHFDGWGDEYDQWMDVESPDIYPVGWCEMVGHRLEPPCGMVTTQRSLTTVKKPPPSDSESDSDCPALLPVSPGGKTSSGNVGPPRLRPETGTGHRPGNSAGQDKPVKQRTSPGESEERTTKTKTSPDKSGASPGKTEEITEKPEENLIKREDKPEKKEANSKKTLVAPSQASRNVVPAQPAQRRFLRSSMPAQGGAASTQRTPRTRSAEGRPTRQTRAANLGAKQPSKETQFGSSDEDKPLLKRMKAASSVLQKRPASDNPDEPAAKLQNTEDKVEDPAAGSSKSVGTADTPAKDVVLDRIEGGLHLPGATDSDPHVWDADDVAAFLKSNGCGAFSEAFLLENIDGAAFLAMKDTNIVRLTSTKVGPAVLIANLIQRLAALSQQRKRSDVT